MILISRLLSVSFIVPIAIVLSLCGAAGATNPGPPVVTSLFVPLAGDVALSDGDVVTFSGEVHVLTQVVFSDDGVPTVGLFVNLVRVEGTSPTTGMTYLLVGASNREIVGGQPGPPNVSEQTFSFSLVATTPGPPTVPPNPVVPIYLRNFVFAQEAGSEGNLQSVDASFFSD